MFVPAFDASILSNFIESDFNLTLPFKNVEIPFESEVSTTNSFFLAGASIKTSISFQTIHK